MKTLFWTRNIFGLALSKAPGRSRRPIRKMKSSVRLLLELLEDRITPSSAIVTDNNVTTANYQTTDWMSALPGSTELTNISLPGTYNSASGPSLQNALFGSNNSLAVQTLTPGTEAATLAAEAAQITADTLTGIAIALGGTNAVANEAAIAADTAAVAADVAAGITLGVTQLSTGLGLAYNLASDTAAVASIIASAGQAANVAQFAADLAAATANSAAAATDTEAGAAHTAAATADGAAAPADGAAGAANGAAGAADGAAGTADGAARAGDVAAGAGDVAAGTADTVAAAQGAIDPVADGVAAGLDGTAVGLDTTATAADTVAVGLDTTADTADTAAVTADTAETTADTAASTTSSAAGASDGATAATSVVVAPANQIAAAAHTAAVGPVGLAGISFETSGRADQQTSTAYLSYFEGIQNPDETGGNSTNTAIQTTLATDAFAAYSTNKVVSYLEYAAGGVDEITATLELNAAAANNAAAVAAKAALEANQAAVAANAAAVAADEAASAANAAASTADVAASTANGTAGAADAVAGTENVAAGVADGVTAGLDGTAGTADTAATALDVAAAVELFLDPVVDGFAAAADVTAGVADGAATAADIATAITDGLATSADAAAPALNATATGADATATAADEVAAAADEAAAAANSAAATADAAAASADAAAAAACEAATDADAAASTGEKAARAANVAAATAKLVAVSADTAFTTEMMQVQAIQASLQTQNADIATQLNAGIRSLDLRGTLVNDTINLNDGQYFTGLTLQNALGDMTSFLQQHPSETIVVTLGSNENPGGPVNSADNFNTNLNTLLNSADSAVTGAHTYSDFIYTSSSPSTTPTLGAVRGKIVIIAEGWTPTADAVTGQTVGWQPTQVVQNISTVSDATTFENSHSPTQLGTDSTLYINNISVPGTGSGVLAQSPVAAAGPVNLAADGTLAAPVPRTTGIVDIEYDPSNASDTDLINEIIDQNNLPITVSSDSDAPGASGTLRAAINQANAQPGVNTIVFASTLTGPTGNVIELQSDLPVIASDVYITGPGVIVANNHQVFQGVPEGDISPAITTTNTSLTFTVTSATDNSRSPQGSGSGTSGDLRYCLYQAIASQVPCVIRFTQAMTISLANVLTAAPPTPANPYGATDFLLSNGDNITIDGSPGITLDGGQTDRPFVVTGGAVLTLKNLTVQNGMAAGEAGGNDNGGGGAGLGGAVYVDGSSELVASACTFLNNQAVGGAGGAAGSTPGTGGGSSGGGTSRNGGFGSGGGSAAVGGSGGFGGGGAGGASGGGAGGFGGGSGGSVNGGGGGGAGLGGAIFSNGGIVALTNDTFTLNSASAGGAGGSGAGSGSGYGGAVFALNGSLTATFDTFTKNGAAQGGTDVYALSDANDSGINGIGPATAALTNDILGQSGVTTVPDFFANATNGGAAPVLTGSNDLISDNPAYPNGFTNRLVNATDPQLGALASNGGPTQTFAPQSASPVRGAGTATAGVSTDQRGDLRASPPDVGAVQVTGPTVLYWLGQVSSSWNADNWGTTTSAVTPSLRPASGDFLVFDAGNFNPAAATAANFFSPQNNIAGLTGLSIQIDDSDPTASHDLRLSGQGVGLVELQNLGTDAQGNETVSLALTGGTVTQDGEGQLTLAGSTDNTSLAAVADSGTLVLAKTSSGASPNVHAIGSTVAGLIINSGATVRLAGTSGDQIANGVNVQDSGFLDLNGNNETVGGLTLLAGTVRGAGTLTSNSAAILFSGSVNAGLVAAAGSVKNTSGTVTLGGSDDNTGLSVTVNAGTLVLAKVSTSSIHAANGSLTINGGTVQLSGSGGDQIADSVTVQVNAGGAFDFNGRNEKVNALALAGNASVENSLAGTTSILTTNQGVSLTGGQNDNVLGAGTLVTNTTVHGNGNNLVMNGAGTLDVLGNQDNDALGLIVNAGTVLLDKQSSSAVHAVESGLTISGGTVQLAGSGGDQIADSVSVQINAGGTFDLNGQNEKVNALTLTGNASVENSLAGTTSILTTNQGVSLTGMHDDAVPGAGTLVLNTSVHGNGNNLVMNGAGTLDVQGNQDNDALGLIVNAGTVLLDKQSSSSAVHAVESGLTINGGLAQLAGSGGDQISTNAGLIINTGGTFDLNGQGETVGAFTLTGGLVIGNALLTVNGTSDLQAGEIDTGLTDSNGATKDSSGTATLGGSFDNSGLSVTVNAGTLVLAKASSASAHAIGGALAINGGTLQLGGSGGDQIADSVSVQLNAGGTFDLNGQSEYVNALTLTGNAGIENSQAGTTSTLTTNQGVSLTGMHDDAVPGAGTLVLNTTVHGNGNNLVMNGAGTLDVLGNQDNDALGLIVNAGTVLLDKQSSSAIHAVESGLTISGGTVQLAGSGGDQIADSVSVQINAGGTFDLNGQNEKVNALTLTGNAGIENSQAGTTSTLTTNQGVSLTGSHDDAVQGAGTLVLNTAVQGNGNNFRMNGPGTLDLQGNQDNGALGLIVDAGTVLLDKQSSSSPDVHAVGIGPIINGGTVQLAGTGGDQIYNGASVVVNGGVLDLNGLAETVGNFTLAGGTVVGDSLLMVNGNCDLQSGEIDANLEDPNGVIKDTTGTVTLGGSHDNVGLGVAVNAGTLVLAKISSPSVHAIGGLGLSINNGGLVQLAGSGDDQIWDGASVTVNAGGFFDLNGQSEHVNALTLTGNAGIENSQAGTTSTLTTNQGVSLTGSHDDAVQGAGTLVLNTAVQGNGNNFRMNGPGTLDLQGNQDNGALGLIVDAGTVLLDKQSSSSPDVHAVGIGPIINGGTVQLAGSGGDQIYNGASVVVNGGVLDLNGRAETVGFLTLAGGTVIGNSLLTVNGTCDLQAGEFDATLEDANGVIKDTTGTVTLGGSHDNVGLGVTVNAGMLILAKTSNSSVHAIGDGLTINGGTVQLAGSGGDQIWDGAGVTVNTGGVLDLNGLGETVDSFTLAGGRVIGNGLLLANGNCDLQAGEIDAHLLDALGVTKDTSGTVTLGGSNDNFGLGVTVNAGTLVLAKISGPDVNAIGAGGLTINGGTVQLAGSGGDQIWDGANVTVNSGGVFDLNSQSENVNALTLTGGASVENSQASTTSTLTTNQGISLTGGQNDNVLGAGTLVIDTAVQGNGNYLHMYGPGTLDLQGNQDNGGLGLIVDAGTVLLDKQSSSSPDVHAVGIGPIINGGLVQLAGSGGDQIYNGASVVVHSGFFDLNGQSEYVNALTLTGNAGIENTLAGTTSTLTTNQGVSLTGSHDDAVQGAGTLVLNTAVHGYGNNFRMYGPGTLDLKGSQDNDSLGLIVDAGTVLLDKQFSYAIGNSGLIINGGTMQLVGTGFGQIDDQASVAVNDGVLDLNGHGEMVSSFTLAGGRVIGDGRIEVNGTCDLQAGEIDGNLEDALGVTKDTSGTVTLGGSYDNFGLLVTVNAGTLVLAKISSPSVNAIGVGGTLTINGGLVKLAGSGGDQIWDGANVTINAGGLLDFRGQSENVNSLTLTGNAGIENTVAGTTSTLTTNQGVTLTGGNDDAVQGAGTLVIDTAVQGNGNYLHMYGPGTLDLKGNQDNGGLGLIVDAGTVLLDKQSSSSPDVHAVGIGPIINGGLVQLAGSGGDQIYNGASVVVHSGFFDLNGQSEYVNSLTLTGNAGIENSQADTTSTLYSNQGVSLTGVHDDAVQGAGTLVIDTAVHGNGNYLHMYGPSTLYLEGNQDNDSLGLIVDAGTVFLDKQSSSTVHALGYGPIINGGTVRLAGSGGDQIYDQANVVVNSGATFDLNGHSEYVNTLTLTGGAWMENSWNGTTSILTTDQGVSLTGGSDDGVTGPGTLVINSAVHGNGNNLHMYGPGTLDLQGNQDNDSLGLIVDAGTVLLDKQSSSPNVHAVGYGPIINADFRGALTCLSDTQFSA